MGRFLVMETVLGPDFPDLTFVAVNQIRLVEHEHNKYILFVPVLGAGAFGHLDGIQGCQFFPGFFFTSEHAANQITRKRVRLARMIPMSLLTRNLDLFDPLDAEIAALGGAANAAHELDVIARHVRECLRCQLHRNRTHAVPGEGDAAASMIIVGEGPGKTEDELGRPFVGKSGELLDKILAAAEIPRAGVFITNIVKCRSADMAGGKLQNRPPTAVEVSSCRPYLVRQVEIVQPRVILCLGGSAAKGVIDANFNITEQRGRWFEGPFGSEIIATFHPAFILRGGGPGTGVAALKRLVWEDMKLVRDRLA